MARKEVAAWHTAYEDAISELNRTGFLQDVVKTGDLFPDFVLPNAEGGFVSLYSVLERGPAIISFFRGEWCPFCQLMLSALAEALPQIHAAGGTLLALTPETAEFPLPLTHDGNARFEVLSDIDCGVGLAAGVIFRMPRLYRARMESAGIDLHARQGNAAWFLPVPATFIVGQDGVIAWRFVDADFTHRAEPAEIINMLRSLTGRK